MHGIDGSWIDLTPESFGTGGFILLSVLGRFSFGGHTTALRSLTGWREAGLVMALVSVTPGAMRYMEKSGRKRERRRARRPASPRDVRPSGQRWASSAATVPVSALEPGDGRRAQATVLAAGSAGGSLRLSSHRAACLPDCTWPSRTTPGTMRGRGARTVRPRSGRASSDAPHFESSNTSDGRKQGIGFAGIRPARLTW